MQSPSRLDAFDALRAFAMILGVVIHAMVAFYPGIAPYHFVQDAAVSPAVPVLGWLIHGFRMQVFFVMAGFFAHLALERRSPREFLGARWRRIGVPLLVLAPLLVIFDVAMRRWSAARGTLSPDYVGGTELLVRPLYLWFLYYLLMFTVAAAALRGRLQVRQSVRLVVPVLVTALVSYWVPAPAPAFSYVPDIASLLYFGSFFAFGYALFKRRDLLEVSCRYALPASAIAVLAAYSQSHVVYAWAMVVTLIGWFMRLANRPSPGVRFAADGAYWVYIVHYPQVVALQILTASWPGHVATKLVSLILVVAITSYGSYALFVRNRALGKVF